ncbi:FxDxF family PEP-CTERM protein [Uliginosibacterium sp. H3]|uniref:FxDxF family PEP-CTERM protein n=1 Tax=Uliginosibacterium silvisoli TaxID=3114758 RepID=A0ABU6K6U6_9RHOO|nr:FxDxF family PEP-CTERM protein [Uliginosibacterium sp. H3]
MKFPAKLCMALALTGAMNAYAVTSLQDGSTFSKIVNVDSGFAFTHTYNFHLDFTGPAIIGASVQELKVADLLDIDWADANAFVVRDALNNVLFSAGETGPIGSFSFDSLLLSTSDFSITLAGEGIGKLDPAGTYAIALFAAPTQVTPVPEPASGAMLLGGAALLGFMARRRTQR